MPASESASSYATAGEAFSTDPLKGQVDEYIRVFRATKPASGTNGTIIPGDPEQQAECERRENGVPLVSAVIEELRDISAKTSIPFD